MLVASAQLVSWLPRAYLPNGAPTLSGVSSSWVKRLTLARRQQQRRAQWQLHQSALCLLLWASDRTINLVERFAACFCDHRRPELIEHAVSTLVGQRVFAIGLGYEDLNDHNELRHDPVMAVLAGKLEARRAECAPVAGKSTLNRLELSVLSPWRYCKIAYRAAAIERLLVYVFLEAHARSPRQIILDLDATDDPLHEHQEGRFFHGYYDCYCYLPLYVFCGRHLLVAKLRPANIDASAGSVEEMARIVAQLRTRWPYVRILLRADSGFAREGLMAWCEENRIDYVFGLAQRPLGGRDRGRVGRRPDHGREDGPAGAALQGLPLAHACELEPKPPRHRQGGVDAGRGQSPLHRHLAHARRDAGAAPL